MSLRSDPASKAEATDSGIQRPSESRGQPEQDVDPIASRRPAEKSPVFEKALDILRSEFPKKKNSETETAQNQRGQGTSPSNQTAPPEDADPIPARMLNEFVYCPRLFYYEFVEGVFVESADTLKGSAIHQRVDSGSGAMPSAASSVRTRSTRVSPSDSAEAKSTPAADSEPPHLETIHSRSVQMGSERLGVIAKMDLVETYMGGANAPSADGNAPVDASSQLVPNLFALGVCPVDYKAGSPREGEEAIELWDTDKMQLGLQILILRDNGYRCDSGIIYYRGTRQRVPLPMTADLELWIVEQIAAARKIAQCRIPDPLKNSPKCVRCSLAPVCLPDETLSLAQIVGDEVTSLTPTPPGPSAQDPRKPNEHADQPRRLMASRDDSRVLYLNTPGLRVGVKNEILEVKERDKVIDQVRIRDVCHVALFGNIQISTQAIQALCEHDTPITYFSMGAWFYGVTRGHGLKNVFLRKRQFQAAEDIAECRKLARQFIYGKIRNHRTMLMRNHLQPPEVPIRKLKVFAENAAAADSIEELLGMEGSSASYYFQNFSGMIKVADDLTGAPGVEASGQMRFNFETRNKRPPTDPVNALLSLAYSMLSKDCHIALLAVGFDPYIGFYHQPRFGRPALALDLMEEFRPLIAESTVLNCINNRVITHEDFVRAGRAVNLSATARKKFFQAYEQRMTSLVTHPLFDYKVSYRRALELQARILGKVLTGEIPQYLPFMTR
jgi:CRISPR-associated protein Cas1